MRKDDTSMEPENTAQQHIIIYQIGNTQIEVQLREESIWLDAHQIATLFEVHRPAIVKHIGNIYKSGELEKKSTCSILEQVAADGKKRRMHLYNLDVIIAVGYRVNSIKATQFRIWATQVLKKYMIDGYVLNEKRIIADKLRTLEHVVSLLKKNLTTPSLSASETMGMLEIIEQYLHVWKWIEEYDRGIMHAPVSRPEKRKLTTEDAKTAIEDLKCYLIGKGLASALFGKEIEPGRFESALYTINQTFNGKDLYPSFEEKAANLLYLIIKNHPFVDGNKRIGALLFLKFLHENMTWRELLEKFNSNTLTALCYLVAASPADQKDQLILLIMNFISFEKDTQ